MKQYIMLAILFGSLLGVSTVSAEIQLDAATVGAGPYYLDQPGETYILTEDIQTPGTALVFSAANITLNLNQHTVTFGTASAAYRYGVVIPPSYAHVAEQWVQSDITHWIESDGAIIENGTVIQGSGNGAECTAIMAYSVGNVTVRGTTSEVSGDDSYAMRLNACNTIFVHGNTITDHKTVVTNRHLGRAAIDIQQAADGPIEVFDNTINDCFQWGIRISRREPSTVWGHVYGNTLYPNTGTTNGYAIGLHGDFLEAYDNTITATNGRGIHIWHCDMARVHHNTVDVIEQPFWDEYGRLSAHGIKLEKCTNAEVYSNDVLSRGIANAPTTICNGSALNFGVETGSNNYIHDNTFTARHFGGTVFDPNEYQWFASAMEAVGVEEGSGLRIENNTFITNDRFFTSTWWAGENNETLDASDVTISGNTWIREATSVPTKNYDIFFFSTSITGLRLVDNAGGDFTNFGAGWPWLPVSWSQSSTGTVETQEADGTPVGDIQVDVINAAGDLVGSRSSDAAGHASFVIDEFTASTVGRSTSEVTEIIDHNPTEIRAFFPEGPMSEQVTIGPKFSVVLKRGLGSGGPPTVSNVTWAFQVVTTSPAPGASDVPPGVEIRWQLSEGIDETTLNGTRIEVVGAGSGPIDGDIILEDYGRRLIFRPYSPMPRGEIISVKLKGSLRSLTGITLDGDRNGIAGGNDADAHEFEFVVGLPTEPDPEEPQRDPENKTQRPQ